MLKRSSVCAAFAVALTIGCADQNGAVAPNGLTTGQAAIEVTVTTSGSGLDDDGYVFVAVGPKDTYEPSGVAALPFNGSATLSLAPDTYSIALAGLAGNCDITSPLERTTTLARGELYRINIRIQCWDALQLTYIASEGFDAGDSLSLPRQFWITDVMKLNATKLTTDPASHETPTWSPDGSVMAFVSNRGGRSGIWLMDVAGHAVAVNTGLQDDFGPRWSPDGHRLVFFSEIEGAARLFTINTDGTDLRGITAGSPGDYDPDWASDGKRIAFARKSQEVAGIWVVNADGSGATRLTSGEDTNPVWSPDGALIAFSRRKERNHYAIVIMKADGSSLSEVASVGPGAHPAWSPSGRKVAFAEKVCILPGGCQAFIGFAGIDGAQYTPITISGLSGDVAWRQQR